MGTFSLLFELGALQFHFILNPKTCVAGPTIIIIILSTGLVWGFRLKIPNEIRNNFSKLLFRSGSCILPIAEYNSEPVIYCLI